MTVDDKGKDEKLQYDINRQAGKISALSPGRIDKYEYLTGEEILPSDQSRIIEQAKFTYSPLGKAFEKQIKTIEEQGKKQVEALEVLKPITQILTIKDAIPENTLSEEAKNELNKIKEIEKTVDRENLYYQTNKYTYNFQNFQIISTFGRDIYNGTIIKKEADEDQSDLLVEMLNFRKQVKPENPEKKQQKEDVLKNLYNLLEGRERVLNAFDSKIFPIKIKDTGFSNKLSDHSNLKILTPKQMLQRLPVTLAQVKSGNAFENLLNEIRQIIYSLYRAKEITKKVYNNIMNSIKVYYKKWILYL